MRLEMTAIGLYVTVSVTAGFMGVGCGPAVQAPAAQVPASQGAAVQMPALQVGLANAPALGGSPIADARVHDVISDGKDSCGRRLDPNAGPLRYRVFPCPGESAPATAVAPVAWSATPDDSPSQEWMEHYHFGWPCKPSKHQALKGRMVLAWSPVLSPPERACGLQ